MVPDHDCVPGLERAVTLSEYAKLEGLREADVLAVIGQLKIPAAYFRGQWFVEAPPNCEARLGQLRAKQRSPDGGDQHVHLAQPSAAGHHPQRVDVLEYPQPPQPASDTQETPRPQPVDYGLKRDDLNLYDNLRTWWWCQLPNGQKIQCLGMRSDDKYKKGRRWFGGLHYWEERAHVAGGFAFYLLPFGGLGMTSKDSRIGGLITLGLGLLCLLCAILPGILLKRLRTRASPALEKYWQTLHAYDNNKAAAEKAAREAARDAELRKHSYWAFLDGYEFERATAEVLNKHQFNPRVTPGSGDGGIDIEVTKNGLKGVVQCKAHVASAGPHVVRDLYDVIHHSEADFGIIVSRGGFSRGAVDFARDKPILFLDTSDLIAMQEGRDVLASAFSRKDA